MANEKNRIIAIVDDDGDLPHLFKLTIGEKIDGYEVFSFNDPILALEHFTQNTTHYALVIADLRMSSLNGLELLKKVKDANPSVRTILMSGYNFDHVKFFEEYKKQGIINSIIEKPIPVQRLTHMVRDELQIYQLINAG